MVQQRAQVDGMTVALASMFDRKVLDKYRQETDAALSRTDFLGPRKPTNGSTSVQDSRVRQKNVAHTIHELNKLNVLLGG